MNSDTSPRYFLVDSRVLPDIFLKVTKAKSLLETGEAATVAQAAKQVGISRSAYYKYKDSFSPFCDIKRGHIITFQMMLRDEMGVLSSVLSIFATSGANILTINQSIPVNGTAGVTISAMTEGMKISTEELVGTLGGTPGVLRIEPLAG